MSSQSCLNALEKIKSKISAAEYLDLRFECERSEKASPPMPEPELPFSRAGSHELLELGVIGLGAGAVAVGAAAVVGAAGISVLGITSLNNQPQNVTTSYTRDVNGNVTSQSTTVV